MSGWRNIAVYWSIIFSESCWLFLLTGIFGVFVGSLGKLLIFPCVFLALVTSSNLSRLLNVSSFPQRWAIVVGLGISVVLMYSIIALQYGVFWPGVFLDNGGDAFAGGRTVLVFAAVLGLWWRGTRIGTLTNYEPTLRTGFRVGLIVLVIAGIAEVAYGATLRVGLVAFPFFATSLAGLALLTLEQEETQSKWQRVLLTFIGGTLGIGALSTLAVGGVLTGATQQFFHLLGQAAYYVTYVAFYLAEKLLRGFFNVLFALAQAFNGGRPLQLPNPPEFLRPTQQQVERGEVTGIFAVAAFLFKWGLLVLLIVGILGFIAWLFWRRSRAGAGEESEERESLRGETDKENQASLLSVFIPHLRPRERPHLYPLPEGADLRSRLLRVYFQALNAAVVRGHPRRPEETPNEYAPTLAVVLPGSEAVALSQDFAAVRYGDATPSEAAVAGLESSVAQAISGTPEK